MSAQAISKCEPPARHEDRTAAPEFVNDDPGARTMMTRLTKLGR